MHSVILTEEQFIRLFTEIKANFGSDSTPGSLGGEITTTALVDGPNGEKKFGKSPETDEIADKVYPQMWGATMRGQNRG